MDNDSIISVLKGEDAIKLLYALDANMGINFIPGLNDKKEFVVTITIVTDGWNNKNTFTDS